MTVAEGRVIRMSSKGKLAGFRVLIVEDEYLLAADLEAALRAQDADVVVSLGGLKEAMDQVARGEFDMAVVDLNLHGQLAYPVADQLARDGIPFVFATGYRAEVIPRRFANVPRWEKPIDLERVVDQVTQLCETSIV
jgi:CheY-like chemotaxis protein